MAMEFLKWFDPVKAMDSVVAATKMDEITGIERSDLAGVLSGYASGFLIDKLVYDGLIKLDSAKFGAKLLTCLAASGVLAFLGKKLPPDKRLFLFVLSLVNLGEATHDLVNILKNYEVEKARIEAIAERASRGEFAEAMREVVKSPEEVWEETKETLAKLGFPQVKELSAPHELVYLVLSPTKSPTPTGAFTLTTSEEVKKVEELGETTAKTETTKTEERTLTPEELNHNNRA